MTDLCISDLAIKIVTKRKFGEFWQNNIPAKICLNERKNSEIIRSKNETFVATAEKVTAIDIPIGSKKVAGIDTVTEILYPLNVCPRYVY